METEDVEAEFVEVARAVSVGIDVLMAAASLYILWPYVRDRPEVEIARRRLSAWWDRVAHEARRLRKMENETVFEAIQVVDHAGD